MANDYDWLQTQMASFLHRKNLSSTIPTLIRFGQKRLDREVKSLFLLKAGEITIAGGETLGDLPSDFNTFLSVRYPIGNGYREIYSGTLAQNSQVLESLGGASASPYRFAIYSDKIEMASAVETSATLKIVYKFNLPEFVLGGDSDVLLENHPDLYLYACLVEAGPYIRDKKAIQLWREEYTQRVEAINDLYDEQRFSEMIQTTHTDIRTP